MLIDCGTDARWALSELGYAQEDIDDVYISHLHADHVGGLEWLAFSTFYQKYPKKITLHMNETLVKPLWENVLSGGLCSMEGKNATLDSYFNISPISSNSSFVWENIEFQLIQTIHAMAGFVIIPCFGLFFKLNRDQVYFTADTQFAPHQILKFYEAATLIFQDCETSELKSGVHAAFEELITLPSDIKRKMWLYHYNPGELPDAKEMGFLGFVSKGQTFLLE